MYTQVIDKRIPVDQSVNEFLSYVALTYWLIDTISQLVISAILTVVKIN